MCHMEHIGCQMKHISYILTSVFDVILLRFHCIVY